MKNDPEYYTDTERAFRRFRRTNAFFYLNIVMLAVNLALAVSFVISMLRFQAAETPRKDTPTATETVQAVEIVQPAELF